MDPLNSNGPVPSSKSKFFVDCLLPDGSWRKGRIAWPAGDAHLVAANFRKHHPDWLVELNPLQGTP